MIPRYSIALAELRHLDALNDIELAAARLLTGHAPQSVLEEATPRPVFIAAMRRGHVWVGLDGDSPVGFAQVEMLAPDLPHLDEIDVHPAHGRRGLGTRLVRAVCGWATAAGYQQLTLTTFRAVPWNMPWYARLGFVELPAAEWRDELRQHVTAETARGLAPLGRLVMTYRCRGAAEPRRAAPHDTLPFRRGRIEGPAPAHATPPAPRTPAGTARGPVPPAAGAARYRWDGRSDDEGAGLGNGRRQGVALEVGAAGNDLDDRAR